MKDNDAEVRAAAARALGLQGDLKLSQAPLLAAAKDKNPQVRAVVIEALAGMKSPKIEGIYISALKDEDPNVRLSAANALAEIKSPKAMKPLVAALKDDSPSVRAAAAEALGALGRPHGGAGSL